ncbi:MAG: hypothetical protein QXH63_00935, partial [Pyrobaculum sp.]
MAAELEKHVGELVLKLRTAERLVNEGKVDEAKRLLKEVLKEAREKRLEKTLWSLILSVRA